MTNGGTVVGAARAETAATVEDELELRTSDAALKTAARVRAYFGFAHDPALLATAAVDLAGHPDMTFGIPLSSVELAEAVRRLNLQRASDDATDWAEAHLDSYAGAWTDPANGGQTVLAIKHGGESQGLIERMPKDSEYTVVEVDRSWKELLDLHERVHSSRDWLITQGIDVAAVGINTPSNTVYASVRDLDKEKEGVLVSLFGDRLSVRDDKYHVTADACPTTDCLPPVRGGLGIFSTVVGNPCTTGYNVRVTSHPNETVPFYGVVTAGHCFRGTPGSTGEGVVWRHELADSGTVVGRALKNTWIQQSTADIGLLRITANGSSTDRNNIITKPGTSTVIRNVASTATNANQKIGDFVCRTGRNSTPPTTCGQIVDTMENRDSPYPGIDTKHLVQQWVVDFDSVGGDSGGPVYQLYGDIYNLQAKAYGTHVHSGTPAESTGWYSTVDNSWAAYANRGWGQWRVCTTDACS